MFDLDFTGEVIDAEGELLHLGVINLDGFIEGFSASLSYWSIEDYHKQWLEGAARLLQTNSRSAFITRMYNPQTENLIQWWPAWHVSNFVIVQQHLLPLSPNLFEDMDEEFKVLASQFSIENPYAAVGDRLATHTQECQKTGICRRPRLGTKLPDEAVDLCPSEWSVPRQSVEEFLNRRTVDWAT